MKRMTRSIDIIIYESLISNLENVFTGNVDYMIEEDIFSMDTSVVRDLCC